jgi:hypothetical protein
VKDFIVHYHYMQNEKSSVQLKSKDIECIFMVVQGRDTGARDNRFQSKFVLNKVTA